jgi:hypothetical protein
MLDGPYFVFVYDWSGHWPTEHRLDLSGSGCEQSLGWTRVAVTHTLDEGQTKRYHKGWKLNAHLSWLNGLLKSTYWDTDTYVGRTEKLLQILFNTPCNNSIWYYPYPSVHPALYYDVMITGDYNFTYRKGLEGLGFTGSIELVGKEVFNEIPYLV